MSVASMVEEVVLSRAVPSTTSILPSLTNNPNPVNTPPATGLITVPQNPSGSVTNQSATFNHTNTITSTQEMLANVLMVQGPQQGKIALDAAHQQTIQGCPNVQINNWYSGSVGTVGTKFS
jgi:hypothetical protein